MDNLENLPVNNNVVNTPEENDVMGKYFDMKLNTVEGYSNDASHSNVEVVKPKSFKFVLYTTLAFVIISNPITDSLLSSITYLSNSLIVFTVKILLFMVFMFVLNRWAM